MSYLKPRNLLLVLALGLALALVAVISLRYSTEGPLPELVKVLPEGVDVSLQDIDYTHIEEGRARWRLTAKQVDRQSDSGVLGLVEPRLRFYDEHGESGGLLQANQGDVSDDYQRVKLRGDVVLKKSVDYTVYTESLDYDHATQLATTDELVRVVSGRTRLEGRGLVFDLKQNRLQLKANVSGSLDAEQMK